LAHGNKANRAAKRVAAKKPHGCISRLVNDDRGSDCEIDTPRNGGILGAQQVTLFTRLYHLGLLAGLSRSQARKSAKYSAYSLPF
jgi:hypothetical protein